VLAVSDEALAPTRFRVRKVDLPDAKPRGSKRLVADSEHKVNVTPPSDVTALLSWTLWTLF